jgi:putative ABC transport system permease protein
MAVFAVRSLRARLSRTLLTAFGIVLGVAVILAINITNQSTLDSILAVFSEASGKAHLIVTSASLSNPGFSEETLGRVEMVSGVGTAVPVLQEYTALADDAPRSGLAISVLGEVGGGLMVYGIDPRLDAEAREYKIAAGEFLSYDLDAYEMVLVEEYARDKDIETGDDIRIVTPEGIEVVRVVGLISKEGPGQLNNGAFAVIPLVAAQEMFSRSGELDQIDVVATSATASVEELDQLRRALRRRLGGEFTVLYPAARGNRVAMMISTYQTGLRVFSAIALFVGAFLIYNAFSMTVVERTREIGMLRTVGMTRRQVLVQILTEAALLGVAGSAVGVAAGVFLSRGLIRAMELLLAQDVRRVTVPTTAVVASVLVGLGVTLVAALIPAWQAARISPLEALRIRGNRRDSWIVRSGWPLGVVLVAIGAFLMGYGSKPMSELYTVGPVAVFAMFVGATLVIPGTVGLWERSARPVVGRLYGNEGRLGGSNIQRAKVRTTLTAAALMVGAAMILTIRATTQAYMGDMKDWIRAYVGGDLYVHSELPMRADLQQRLQTVEGVQAVTPLRYFDCVYIPPDGFRRRLQFMAIDVPSYQLVTSFVFSAGQGPEEALAERLHAGGTVFVSSLLSERFGYEQGGTIRLETRRGTQDFEVAAVVTNFQNSGLVVQGSWGDMRRYFGINDVTAFLISTQPGYAPNEVRDRIEDLYGQRRHLTIESNESLRGRALGLMDQSNSMFDVLALISMLVASLGVVNTMTMNVYERTQEIGMLRSVGMTRWQVARMILAEAGMMGFIGGVLGLTFGLFLSALVVRTSSSAQGIELAFTVPTEGVVATLIIALVVSQVAAIWPARRAATLPIIEAIQFE